MFFLSFVLYLQFFLQHLYLSQPILIKKLTCECLDPYGVTKNSIKVALTNYLDSDLCDKEPNYNKHKLGEVVTINGVYVSSISTEKLMPKITKEKLLIENIKNIYLLENDKIGCFNDDCIVSENELISCLSNPNYIGNSIVNVLNQINIDSSYSYCSKLISINEINNYIGRVEQNLLLLDKLRKGQ